MAKVLFYTATAAQFAALPSKNENAIYFISDTGEIFKGDVPFSFPCRLVDTLPPSGDKGFIYISSLGAMKIWTGSAWLDVGGGDDNFLTSAVRHTVTAGEAGSGIFAGISEGDIGVVFTLVSGTKMYVSLTDLVNIYTADNAGSKAIAVSIAGNTISADLNISQAEGNCLEIKDDGVFVGVIWRTPFTFGETVFMHNSFNDAGYEDLLVLNRTTSEGWDVSIGWSGSDPDGQTFELRFANDRWECYANGILCFTAPGNSDEDFTLATWTAVDTGTIAVSWEYF